MAKHSWLWNLSRKGKKQKTGKNRWVATLLYCSCMLNKRVWFYCDNYLGTSLQINNLHDDWLTFWRANRLEPQLQLFAQEAGKDSPLIKKVISCRKTELYLGRMEESAVLLHGDLWFGKCNGRCQWSTRYFRSCMLLRS